MIDLKDAILEACDYCDSTGVDGPPAYRAAFIMGYLIGGPLMSDREVYIRVYGQTPEESAGELSQLDDITRARAEEFAIKVGMSLDDVKEHLESGYRPKLSLVK